MLFWSKKSADDPWEGVYSGVLGLFLGLVLIKFGNPAIMDRHIQAPTNQVELLVGPWPLSWGYLMLIVVGTIGLRFWRWQLTIPCWWAAMPLVWLAWQFVSAFQTIDRGLTRVTLTHFVACVVLYLLGLTSFSRVTRVRPFWIGLLGGFLVVLTVGWRQHFGGLEETRGFLYSLPNWQSLSSEFLKKVASDRIYSTLFYPNALAGVVLLLMPVAAVLAWRSGGMVSKIMAWVLSLGTMGLSLGCLYWSGSKSGWLIGLMQGVTVLFRQPNSNRARGAWLVLLVFLGLGGFAYKYLNYFEKGATSITARFDYWKVAMLTIKESPVLGSGPGTFMIRYKQLKPREAEMTRLAHNDFLQQASDSGLVGGIAYLVWCVGGICILYQNSSKDSIKFSIWLGLLGIVGQGFLEFGLYIPAISWLTFFLMGWLGGIANQMDKLKFPS